MSPAKAKSPTPEQKTSTPKAKPADGKPAAARGRPKSPKTAEKIDSADAVADGLTSGDSEVIQKPAAKRSPKSSGPKAKSPAQASAPEAEPAHAEATGAESAGAGGSEKKKSGPDSAEPASTPRAGKAKSKSPNPAAEAAPKRASATERSAAEKGKDLEEKGQRGPSVPGLIDARAGKPESMSSENADTLAKAAPIGSPPTASGPQPEAHTAPVAPETKDAAHRAAEQEHRRAVVASDAPEASAPVARETNDARHRAADAEQGHGSAAVAPATPAAPTPAAKPADKAMELPKGALIAFRKSGGLKFSSREVVMYPDGRVTYDGGDTAKSALTRAARRMSDAQVVRLRRLLDQINFFGMKPPKIQADPDGFVLEIAARLGGKNNHIEVNAAGLPGALNALVEQLSALLPNEEQQADSG